MFAACLQHACYLVLITKPAAYLCAHAPKSSLLHKVCPQPWPTPQMPAGKDLQIGSWVLQKGANGALDIQNNGVTRASIDTNGLLSVTTGDNGGIRIGDYRLRHLDAAGGGWGWGTDATAPLRRHPPAPLTHTPHMLTCCRIFVWQDGGALGVLHKVRGCSAPVWRRLTTELATWPPDHPYVCTELLCDDWSVVPAPPFALAGPWVPRPSGCR